MIVFHEHLKKMRKERNLTQKQVATAVGITERNYQLYEAGLQKPGFDSLIALADCFGVSLDYLVGRSHDSELQ